MDERLKVIISKEQIKEIYEMLVDMKNINYVLIKGEALSLVAYGEVGKRHLGDIDILVPKDQIQVLDQNLIARGYRRKCEDRIAYIYALCYSHQIPSYYKKMNCGIINVDVNFDIVWGGYEGKKIDLNFFLKDKQQKNIYGYEFNVMSPLKTLIYIILHNYKDMNSLYHIIKENPIKTEKFKDIYYLIINNSQEITVEEFVSVCEFLDINRYAYYMLYFTFILFPVEIVKKYRDAVYCKSGEELLDMFGLTEDEKRKWDIDFRKRLNNEKIRDVVKLQLSKKELEKIEKENKIF